jgi:hypothetical protein
MCVQIVLQLVFHEGDVVKCPLVFDLPKILDCNTLGQFNIFQKLVVKDGKCRYFHPPFEGAPKVVFMNTPMWKHKLIFHPLWICNIILCINHIKSSYDFVLKEVFSKLLNHYEKSCPPKPHCPTPRTWKDNQLINKNTH